MTKPKAEKAEKKEKKPRAPKTVKPAALTEAAVEVVDQAVETHQRQLDDLAFCTDKLITWAVNRHPDVPDVASYIQAKSRLT